MWALWLSAVPYGMWSEKIRRPSMEEHTQWLEKLEQVLGEALRRFGISLREGVTVNDLACAFASLIEGVWLNQCMTTRHPSNPSEPIASSLRRSGRLLWSGATEPTNRVWIDRCPGTLETLSARGSRRSVATHAA